MDTLRKISHRLRCAYFAPRIKIEPGVAKIVRLGSRYGGWILEDSPDLHGATIVSCGLGEDASFDCEFAAKYSATVIIVDPTPRAVAHFTAIQAEMGRENRTAYVDGGKQPISAYPLSRLSADMLRLEPSALWTENTVLKFFAPPNPAHVSHSIINFQNNYATNTDHIEVPSVTLDQLVAKYNLTDLPLLKLDIEGAEVDVLLKMTTTNVRPRQVLVEFDEMLFPSSRGKERAESVDQALRSAGYTCRYKDGPANFLYVRDGS
ncbi:MULTISPECIES: FkbM family methyltransferase [unclassified Bradyrhizobium]|uniref:FkbM family methyltransferase n=1 Tax=unclassified Bradyrhizobium TaxID=2631580 RepID=UPI00211E19D5|nr:MULTISPECIES: FkbM family methyltransferase [unclassified Bradyrhizobium]